MSSTTFLYGRWPKLRLLNTITAMTNCS